MKECIIKRLKKEELQLAKLRFQLDTEIQKAHVQLKLKRKHIQSQN